MSAEKPKDIANAFAKVPEVTLGFWVIKILATTLGEAGGDALTMGGNAGDTTNPGGIGYLNGTFVFAAIFLVAVLVQVFSKKFNPVIYWVTIVATTTVGTTLADFCDRSLHVGYTGGTSILFVLLMGSLFTWNRVMGSISINTVDSPRTEVFYWVAIMFSQTLGTALGDWTADSLGFKYIGATVLFGSLLAVIAALYFWTKISRTILFWAAFILTRPLGAVAGDLLDKPQEDGGMHLNRYIASGVIAALIFICIFVFPHRAAKKAH